MDDKQQKFGSGRGAILLKMLRDADKSDSSVIAAAAATSASMSASIAAESERISITQSQPTTTIMSKSSVSTPGVGRGRASLLNIIKTKQSEPETIIQVPTVGIGRASLFQTRPTATTIPVPTTSSMEKPPSPVHIPGPSGDAEMSKELTCKMSSITIDDSRSISDIPSLVPLPSTQYGSGGKPTQLLANYIKIKSDPGRGVFIYEVKFNPDIDSRPLRSKLLNQHVQTLGKTKVFDGVTLFLPIKLQDQTIIQSTHPMDGSTVTLTLIYKKEENIFTNTHFFNNLLKRVMRALSLVRIGQHSFNPKGIHAVPQHKLEVWPGYVAVINKYEAGLMLCLDARHRVMRTETVREILGNFTSKPNYKEMAMREMIGLSVFTRYNNKTYRIDDIAWDKNPTYVFEKGDDKISLLNYYKQHWNLQIKDDKQPLLVHCAKRRTTTGERVEQLILLVPELCYIASLTESIRSDFRVMKDLDALTKMSPNARRDVYRHFVQEIQSNELPREILAEWGLRLESDVAEFEGRVLDPEEITFGNNKKFQLQPHKPADWSSAACRSVALRSPKLNNWCVLYCQRDTRCTQEFVGMFKNVSKVIGLSVNEPQMICLRDDRIETYIQQLRSNIQDRMNLMVIIFPTNRTDRYSAVKRVCCVDSPVASQVIMSRTISRGDKLKSITEKIALQITCKLGGALWALSIPMENCMICGIDVYHGGIGQSTKSSVAGFVASLDKLLTVWHSKICLQGRHQELVDMLQICMISAIKAYYKHNQRYPDRIIVYRDGVGDGQIDTVTRYEVKQLLATFKNIEPSYQPTLTVIIVQKRINTRLFARSASGLENPLPGTIVDSFITKSNIYDFYLVSQNIRQGTVSPTHYIVVYDSKRMKAEHIQRLTYKLCHLYYNWPGTIKVPAPCQYAHKLVSLVGQNIQSEPHPALNETLYYL
ncbi:argonaute 3 [Calliopsis andreniformis]|uniref:argonaute 3 n=1 Tax=Calliopsis andreniformis TaxID=337506 RepID=UPI003FCD090A